MKTPTFLFKRALSVLSLLMLMFLFQNCGVSEDSITDALSEYETQRADALPFAFDLTVDHIAYMSCEGELLQQSSTHFNFKAGAYNDNEGLKFKDSFFESSAVGALGGNKKKLLSYLASSARNQGAGVVMSLRESGDFRGPSGVGGGEADYVSPMLWNPSNNVQLTETTISGRLYDNPAGVNYLSGLSGTTGKSFDAQLGFNGVGVQGPYMRPILEDSGYLAFTFATTNLDKPGYEARSPVDPLGTDVLAKSSVFGKGYKMGFNKLDAGRPGSLRVVAVSVDAYNMESDGTTLGEEWECSEEDRYIIMKDVADAKRRYDLGPTTNGDGALNQPWNEEDIIEGTLAYDDGGKGVGGYYYEYMEGDILADDPTDLIRKRHKVLCPMVPDQMVSGQAEHTSDAWKRVRNILGVDDWYVFRGPRYNCIVPKKNSVGVCYGKLEQQSGSPVVQYFADEDFIDDQIALEKAYRDDTTDPKPDKIPLVTVTDCGGTSTPNRFCPQVLSICHKK